MNYPARNYGSLFGALFEAKTKSDKFWLWVGTIGGTGLFLGSPIGLLVERYIAPGSRDQYERWLGISLLLCLAAFCLSFVVLAIRVTGRQAGKTNFATQSLTFFWKLFLYLFLPCLVITAALLLWAYLAHQPLFQY